MVKRYRDLTEKYRSFRLQPDGQYQSRFIQTILINLRKRKKGGGTTSPDKSFKAASIQRSTTSYV